MQLTRAADYAVRVMVHLAGLPPATRASRAELAIAANNRITHVADRLKTKDEPRTRAQIRADVLSDLLITGVDGLVLTVTVVDAEVAWHPLAFVTVTL